MALVTLQRPRSHKGTSENRRKLFTVPGPPGLLHPNTNHRAVLKLSSLSSSHDSCRCEVGRPFLPKSSFLKSISFQIYSCEISGHLHMAKVLCSSLERASMQPLEAGSNPITNPQTIGGLDCWVFPCPRQCRRASLEAALIWPGGWPGWDLRGLVWPRFCFQMAMHQQATRDASSLLSRLPDVAETRSSPHTP